jgi:hypothetical protein
MASCTLHFIKEIFNLPPMRDKKAHGRQQPGKNSVYIGLPRFFSSHSNAYRGHMWYMFTLG